MNAQGHDFHPTGSTFLRARLVAPRALLCASLLLSLAASACGGDGSDDGAPSQGGASNNGGVADGGGPQDDLPGDGAGEDISGEPDASNNDAPGEGGVSAPARPDAPAYGSRGQHAVGFQAFEVVRDGGAPLSVKAWYPALNPEERPEVIAYDVDVKFPDWSELVDSPVVFGRALEGAPINDGAGAWPVVLFSHGYGLSAEWYSALVEHYASRGFVVLAPSHGELEWLEAAEASFERPVDVRDALDLAEALNAEGGPWAGTLAMDKVALVGHSYGGYTALASAGARIDLSALEERCAALAPEDPAQFLCAPFVSRADDMAALAGLEAPPEGLWPSLQDDRIAAIVPIAGDAYLFGERGLAQVEVPMMAIGGTADFGTPWAWGPEPAYQYTSGETRALVGLEGGNHFLPTNPCEDMPWVSEIAELYAFACFEPVWDKARAIDLIQHYSTAFLLSTFQEDAEATAALDPAAQWYPGILYQATMP